MRCKNGTKGIPHGGDSFQTALEAEPGNPRLLLEAGRFYAEDNQNKESAAAFEKVLKTDIPAETRPIVENYLSELGKTPPLARPNQPRLRLQ